MMATNYGNANAIVPEVLTGEGGNYETWSIFMKNYLLAHNHWDIIESSSGVPDKEDDQYKTWSTKNAWALHAIQISCSPDSFFWIKKAYSAKRAWDQLASVYEIEKDSDDFEGEVYETIPAENVSSERTSRFMPLRNAIRKGDPDKVRESVLEDPEAIREVIDFDVRHTALHVAVTTEQFRIVKLLVEWMQAEDLEVKDIHGNTALCLAAHKGATEIAKLLIWKNPALLSIANREGKIPIVLASERGHKDITYFLYTHTPLADILFPTMANHGISLVVSCTMNEMFDLALDFLRRCPKPTEAEQEEYDLLRFTLLYQLCRLPYVFRSGCSLGFWQGLLYSCVSHFHQKEKEGVSHVILGDDIRINIYDFEDKMIHNGNGIWQRIRQVLGCRRLSGWRSTLLGIKRICDMKVNHNHVVLILRCICQQMSGSNVRLHNSAIYEVIQEAIKHGITEFVVEVIKAFPDVIWFSDEGAREILISAIENRQEVVFSLLYELYPSKDALATFTDDKGNNLLHLVASLDPDHPQVARINGGALQMQSELRWYKAVESIVLPTFKHARNWDGETPHQIFTKHHKNLLSKGEEWMKKTANSSTLVATLIITVAFAAAFTVPGGNQNSGYPIFLHKVAFLIFVVADAVSLFMATASALMFVGIITSRFADEDFSTPLPTTLILFCLSTLFISIATMMTAFCAALVIILRGRLLVIIPIVALACIPIVCFVRFQFPILAELITSTYGQRRSFFIK